VPYFWLALIAISLFSVTLGWFPASGSYNRSLVPEWSWEFIGSVIYHGTLPALTIVIASVAGWILGMRNMMVTVSSEDYVTVAQAKGLPERAVMFGYAARNAILPQISSFALSLGFIVGGTLVMEIVFSYQGIGYYLFTAVSAYDYPLMQGIFLVITIAVLGANIVADFAYGVLDPRTREEG
jgi:peptide/nickel transport system permease protein